MRFGRVKVVYPMGQPSVNLASWLRWLGRFMVVGDWVVANCCRHASWASGPESACGADFNFKFFIHFYNSLDSIISSVILLNSSSI
jgi:hypothetical protein